jgi:outer membrane receptor protein involved in Fe transport
LTFNSDTVNSFEVGAKNNFDNRVKIASSVYYIRWNNIQQTVVPPFARSHSSRTWAPRLPRASTFRRKSP